MLKIFIESACSNGTLSDGDRELIFKKGKEQGLNPDQIQKMIDEALASSSNNDDDLASGFITEDNNDENIESGFITENDDNTNDENLESGFITDNNNNSDNKNTSNFPKTAFTNVSELDSQGAMSLVLKGKLHGKWIIIKRIKPKFKDNAKYKELFFKEFENAYHLDHPNIVRLLDKGEDADGAYYTMEFIDGRPLSEVITKEGVKNKKHVRKILNQLLDGLSYVHKKQIFHRDLKPDNIYITFRGDNVKILDFGLAAADSFDDDLVKVGTPRYAAPEQMTKGNTVDQRADIYTLGLILLEMLTGDVKDKSANSVTNPNYKHVIQKCLKQNPNERFDDCQEITEALNTPILKETKDEPIKIDEPKPPKEKKKFPIIPIFIGLLIVALVIVGFLFKDKIFGSFKASNNTDSEAIVAANSLYEEGKFEDAKNAYQNLMNENEEFNYKGRIDSIDQILNLQKEADELFDKNLPKAKAKYSEIKEYLGASINYNYPDEKIEEINKFYENIDFKKLESNLGSGKFGFSFNGVVVIDHLFDDMVDDNAYKKGENIIQVKKGSKWGCFYNNDGKIFFIECKYNKIGLVTAKNRYWTSAAPYCEISDTEKINEYMTK